MSHMVIYFHIHTIIAIHAVSCTYMQHKHKLTYMQYDDVEYVHIPANACRQILFRSFSSLFLASTQAPTTWTYKHIHANTYVLAIHRAHTLWITRTFMQYMHIVSYMHVAGIGQPIRAGPPAKRQALFVNCATADLCSELTLHAATPNDERDSRDAPPPP